MFRKVLIIISLFIIAVSPNISAYYLGLKSSDNTVSNIQNIEYQYGIRIPVVSFIFDPRDETKVIQTVSNMASDLGRDRIYHITISPDKFTAQQVADGSFDTQYLRFFQSIKEKKLKVIFRTMHEMNGGWYPRSSNPSAFKSARIHVRELSRQVGLDQSDILFDWSVNHWDMPTTATTPSQSSPLTQCTPDSKDCFHFEDYYPGDTYVDLVGFTFYNRGKATSGRQRLTPSQILLDTKRNTLSRLKKLNKPLIIDEVGTTSVRYASSYSAAKSREIYLQNSDLKDQRLLQLQDFIVVNPEILVATYFNVDYTDGLQFPTVGEADRAVLNPSQNKMYQSFFSLYDASQLDISTLASYFLNSKPITLADHPIIATKKVAQYAQTIDGFLTQKFPSTEQSNALENNQKKSDLLSRLLSISRLDSDIQSSLSILHEIYTPKD